MKLVPPLQGRVPGAERREAWATSMPAPSTFKESCLRAVDPDGQVPGLPQPSAQSWVYIIISVQCDFGRASAGTTYPPPLFHQAHAQRRATVLVWLLQVAVKFGEISMTQVRSWESCILFVCRICVCSSMCI